MFRIVYFAAVASLALIGMALACRAADATEDFARWPELVNPFESTSGGGVMIDGYKPVIDGAFCRTDFSVKLPDQDKATIFSVVEFDARAVAGGILCENGRWHAKDGSAEGTTPFRVFIKDGIVRRPPV